MKVEEVVNTGKIERLDQFVAADYRDLNHPSFGVLGLEGCRAHTLAVRRTYPDLHLTIEDQIAEGELVATCVLMTGTHRGEWPPGAKPTGKPVRIRGVNIDPVRNDRIVAHGGAANELAAFIEIGLIRFDSQGRKVQAENSVLSNLDEPTSESGEDR